MAGEIFIARQDTLEAVKTAVGTPDYAGGGTDVITMLSEIKTLLQNSGGGIKKVQRGTATAAGTITIEEVNVNKAWVQSVSKGSAGYVAARGTVAMESASISGTATRRYSSNSGSPSDYGNGNTYSWTINSTLAAHNGTLSGGTTDLTVKEYSAVLTDSTTLTCDGPCEWQVIEFY